MPNDDPPRDFADWICLSRTPDWMRARLLGGLVGTGLILFTVFLVAAAIWLITASLQSTANTAPGTTLGAGGLIVALLGAPFLIWNTVIKQKSLGFQKEGHITDRISKAVEQLGAEKNINRQRRNNAGKLVYEKGTDGEPDYTKPVTEEVTVPNIAVRIGGVLSLERIAQDSANYDNGRDQVRIMEMICAYIRDNAPLESASEIPRAAWKASVITSSQPSDQLEDPTREEIETWLEGVKSPRTDLQIALQVVGRRNKRQRDFENTSLPTPYMPNLSRVNLQRANLSDLNLSNVNFFESSFDGAYCNRAHFVGSNLQGCSMVKLGASNVQFDSCKLGRTDFSHAVLDGSVFLNCDYRLTDFHAAQMIKTKFKGSPTGWVGNFASFQKVNIAGAIFDGFNFNDQFSLTLGDPKNTVEANLANGCAFRNSTLTQPLSESSVLLVIFGDGSVTLPSSAVRPLHWPSGVLQFDAFKEEWDRWLNSPST